MQNTFANVGSSLQTTAMIVAILTGLITSVTGAITIVTHLKSAGQTGRAQILNWVLVLGPLIMIPGGIMLFVLWNEMLTAAVLVTIGFILQTIFFLREEGPVNRRAIVNFGLASSGYALAIAIIVLGHFITEIIKLLSKQLSLIEQITR
jgi:hypothetical protein